MSSDQHNTNTRLLIWFTRYLAFISSVSSVCVCSECVGVRVCVCVFPQLPADWLQVRLTWRETPGVSWFGTRFFSPRRRRKSPERVPERPRALFLGYLAGVRSARTATLTLHTLLVQIKLDLSLCPSRRRKTNGSMATEHGMLLRSGAAAGLGNVNITA